MNSEEMKKVPQIEQLLDVERVASWDSKISRQLVAATVRVAIEYSREKIKNGQVYNEAELLKNIDKLCAKLYSRRLRPVINATGVILHTNMGRSPIIPEIWDECKEINTGYSNLELSIETGKRGKRNGLIPLFIQSLTGAESGSIVNNNAAAIFLVMSTFAAGKEIIVSRSEEVQIGGSFRIPELVELSGAKLVEVGTTNITTLDDYLHAVNENTAMVLKVQRSGFALRGFTSSPKTKELTAALPEGVLMVIDQGSGVLNENLPGERKADALISAGADLITFSCDKIIGGPQAGIIAGKKELIAQIDRNPLMRTMRPGKTIYSLVETSLMYRINEPGSISRHAAAAADTEQSKEKCKKLKRGISADIYKLVENRINMGGGSAADKFFDSWAVEIVSDKLKAEQIIDHLRRCEPPIIGIIKNEKAVINPLTFSDEELKYVKSMLKELEELLI